ncbi:Gelsolin [Oopsacas minuta]|uniref:Gelsolin n=1 Tax=Oopsacas minuta TaxID=111878 RepID=A0AAV7JKM8_9METZ|nr:Gelsolin [Oopsacas minuta]
MAGLVKAKEYDWKDSNVALIGSDLDRSVKKEAAKTEPAWKGAGEGVGVQIWRIEKFKVVHWPKSDYGSFYNGDSYIILNTYKEEDSDALLYDLHFWIGKHSSQDEYGTAAYKTVELDTLLDDKPIQHREVEGEESSLFKTYFPIMTMWDGGVDTGFRHVEPEKYRSRLLHLHGDKKHVEIKEVSLKKALLDSSDVFILDLGLKLFQYNGATSNKDEKYKAVQYMQDLKSRRPKAITETLEEHELTKTHEFMKALSDDGATDSEKNTKGRKSQLVRCAPQVFKVSDQSGKLEMSHVSDGKVTRAMLDPNDVFIIDIGDICFVWVGDGASPTEKQNGMPYAHNYLMKTEHPLARVTVIKQANEKNSKDFKDLF